MPYVPTRPAAADVSCGGGSGCGWRVAVPVAGDVAVPAAVSLAVAGIVPMAAAAAATVAVAVAAASYRPRCAD